MSGGRRAEPQAGVRSGGSALESIGLAALAFLPIVLFAARAELWAPDEPRYAQVAKEAWEGGGLLVMHLNGAVYPDKPPLLYWLAGASGKLGGYTEFALRLPSLLATLGTAWIAARLARRWWGAREAALVPFFWFSTVMVSYIGGRLQIDPLLTFFCIASIDLASAEPRPRMAAAGLCAGLAALCKGPVAWVHVLLALVAWRLLPRAARAPLARSPAAWALFAGLALGPVLVWALAATAAEPSLGQDLFFGQHIGRAVEGKNHPGPPWDYLLDLPAQLLPWTPLFLAAMVRSTREWKRARSGEEFDLGLLRAASWLLLVFVFFSILPTKRGLYLLPIYPVAALLCARETVLLRRAVTFSRLVSWGTALILLIAGFALVATAAIPDYVASLSTRRGEALEGLELLGRNLAIVGAPLVLAGSLALAPRASARAWVASIGAGFALAGTLYALAIVPLVNPAKSAREVAEWIAARPEKPSQIACWGVRPEGYRFYADLPAVAEELVPALEREGGRFLGLVQGKAWGRMSAEDRSRFEILRTRGSGDRSVIVLGGARAPR